MSKLTIDMQTMPQSPKNRYAMLVRSGEVDDDPAQQLALDALDRLYFELINATDPEVEPEADTHTVTHTYTGTHTDTGVAIKGLYFWGSVGRGKTFLMDLLSDSLPSGSCLRLHFHHFMASIHEHLHELEGHAEPLKIVAEGLKQQYSVLCFDEFFVSDIGDAMLLGRLLQYLFELNMTLVATSNTEPAQLYLDGLQRSRFMPAIHAIENYTDTVKLTGVVDHRHRPQPTNSIYHVEPDDLLIKRTQRSDLLERYMLPVDEPAGLKVESEGVIEVMGRSIPIISRSIDAICFEFAHLCEGPRSQNDYIILAKQFQTILLVDIPPLSGHAYERIKARGTEDGDVGSGATGERAVKLAPMDDAVRRFIALVDELYERKVVLVLSSVVPLSELYREGSLSFEFERAKSRITEMASVKYQSQPHQP